MTRERSGFDPLRLIPWVAILGFLAFVTIATLFARDLAAERISGRFDNEIRPADVAALPEFVARERAKVRAAREIR